MVVFSKEDSNTNIFEYKDVLIGAFKSKSQFSSSIQNKFYHIPAFMLDDHPYQVKYIALYQSLNLWGHESGIFYYGEVESSDIVKRSTIEEIPKESDEEYIRFNIKQWRKLHIPIQITSSNIYVCEFTNHFLLTHSRYMYQLSIDNMNDFRLSALLNDAINDIRINEENADFGFDFEGYRIDFRNDKIFISKDNVSKAYFNISDYIKKPDYVFNAIINTII